MVEASLRESRWTPAGLCGKWEGEVGERNGWAGGVKNTRVKEEERVRGAFRGMLEVAQARCGPAPETWLKKQHYLISIKNVIQLN